MRIAAALLCTLLSTCSAFAQSAGCRPPPVRARLLAMPRRRRQRRRARARHRDAALRARRRGAGDAGARRPARRRHARLPDPGPGHARAGGLSPDAAAQARLGARTRDGRDDRRPNAHGARTQPDVRGPAAPVRRPAHPPAAEGRRPLPARHVAGRLADLQRPARRQPLQRARPDRQEQRDAARSPMDRTRWPTPRGWR